MLIHVKVLAAWRTCYYGTCTSNPPGMQAGRLEEDSWHGALCMLHVEGRSSLGMINILNASWGLSSSAKKFKLLFKVVVYEPLQVGLCLYNWVGFEFFNSRFSDEWSKHSVMSTLQTPLTMGPLLTFRAEYTRKHWHAVVALSEGAATDNESHREQKKWG